MQTLHNVTYILFHFILFGEILKEILFAKFLSVNFCFKSYLTGITRDPLTELAKSDLLLCRTHTHYLFSRSISLLKT